jgi:hypothetical protein
VRAGWSAAGFIRLLDLCAPFAGQRASPARTG